MQRRIIFAATESLMNILVISFLAVVSLTTFPTQTYCTPAASSSGTHDPKKSVAAAEAAQPVNDNGLKEIWQEDDRECRYTKGPWTECDATTNKRSRTLSLKKGESSCVQTRTIEKKCKKACRYDKGAWSDCDSNGQMSRTDSLKQSSDTTCQTTRVVNKNCNQGKSKDKQNKPPKAEKKEKVRKLKRFLKLHNKQKQLNAS
uniref:Pleiotrophin/Midkine C-terminal domain-containing protein n=1 Tax=Anopheles culicifacies TaxID=139723 RepID=A0A182LX03_9DIPT